MCRQLGYLRALSVTGEASFGAGVGRIWLDDVECMGSEENITFCTHQGWGITNCDHGDDAGVVCTGAWGLPLSASFPGSTPLLFFATL